MLRAVIFDFNGIIVDDEPIHFELFQKVLAEEGIELTNDAYYARYLGFDDRGAFSFGYHEHNRPLSQEKLAELIARKAVYYQEAIRNHVAIFPGVKKLVAELAQSLPLAVASGALRNEIETILTAAKLNPSLQSGRQRRGRRTGQAGAGYFFASAGSVECARTVTPSKPVNASSSKIPKKASKAPAAPA